MQRLGAFGVVRDSLSRVLLCHRTDIDAWNLPGGGVERGESPWDAIVREVAEEVGLDIQVENLVGLYFIPEHVNEVADTHVYLFRCIERGGSIQLSDEADAIDWFSVSSLPSSTLPRHVERIMDATGETEHLFMRTQA